MSRSADFVWTPPRNAMQRYRVGRFAAAHGHRDYESLWQWSVREPNAFWTAVWQWFAIDDDDAPPAGPALADARMPGAVWFPNARVNFARSLLSQGADDEPALLGRSQTRKDVDLTFGELRDQVAQARTVLTSLGVARGDRVVGYLPNVPEAVVAFLATASLGAVWASCASEFGARAVIDRFAQVEPVVLLVAGGYRYGTKDVDRRDAAAAVRAGLPTLRHVLDVEYGPWRVPQTASWPDALAAALPDPDPPVPVPFDHPLTVLFSSGTTGIPKAIVHGHGGVLLEHRKNHGLSWDLGPGDRLQWYTTTAWMMWNALVSALLVGASAVLLDGDPAAEDLRWQWRLAAETRATMIGLSPGFVMACRAAGVDVHDLGLRVRIAGAAGAPLPPEGYTWIREQLGDVPLIVGSGGTDVCSGIVQGCPLQPVRAGWIAGPALGVDVHAYDAAGHDVVDEPGELVIAAPMPSMPVAFWDDDDGTRLHDAYFATFDGVWRHGDWIVMAADGSCRVTGRSDATLNRGGVRLGTAEFYAVVEELPQIADSLVVHLEGAAGGPGELLLFVVTAEGTPDDSELREVLRRSLRAALSPRHVPDRVVVVPVVPRNLTGKKLELPVKRILQGARVEEVASPDALADPHSLDPFAALAAAGRR